MYLHVISILRQVPRVHQPWLALVASYIRHQSAARSLELHGSIDVSAASVRPISKVIPTDQQPSAASLQSSDLLRQLCKDRLVVRCMPTSAPRSSQERKLLRLTLARAPSTTTLRRALRLLHFVRRVSSVRISREEGSHFGSIESWSRSRGRRSAFRRRSSIARLTALASALRPEVSWLLGWLMLRLVGLRLLDGRG